MTAAEPRLASTILGHLDWEFSRPAKRRRLRSGCTTLDEALSGGFAYGDGSVICINGDTGAGKTLVSRPNLFGILFHNF